MTIRQGDFERRRRGGRINGAMRARVVLEYPAFMAGDGPVARAVGEGRFTPTQIIVTDVNEIEVLVGQARRLWGHTKPVRFSRKNGKRVPRPPFMVRSWYIADVPGFDWRIS